VLRAKLESVQGSAWATIGNHEYTLADADTTFDYFGERVGPRDLGYSSLDVGNWHLVMLNSNSSSICAPAQAVASYRAEPGLRHLRVHRGNRWQERFNRLLDPAPSASNVEVVDGDTITATLETKSGGPPRDRLWDVRVSNPDGSSGVLVEGLAATNSR
jgi:hypothetical protein